MRCSICGSAMYAGGLCPNCSLGRDLTALVAERDHWKARAEAAEAREQAWREAAEALWLAIEGERSENALALLAHARSLGRG